jgi:hypothetical protein
MEFSVLDDPGRVSIRVGREVSVHSLAQALTSCQRSAELSRALMKLSGYNAATLTKFEILSNFAAPARPTRFSASTNSLSFELQSNPMAGTERQRELRRRRHRKSKLQLLHKKSEKSSKAEKAVIAQKIRRLSPGAEQLIQAWKLV